MRSGAKTHKRRFHPKRAIIFLKAQIGLGIPFSRFPENSPRFIHPSHTHFSSSLVSPYGVKGETT